MLRHNVVLVCGNKEKQCYCRHKNDKNEGNLLVCFSFLLAMENQQKGYPQQPPQQSPQYYTHPEGARYYQEQQQMHQPYYQPQQPYYQPQPGPQPVYVQQQQKPNDNNAMCWGW